jgi:phasin family protein
MSLSSNQDQSISVAFDGIRDFNVKMIDMAHANLEAFFGFARELATAKAPSDIMELSTAHARKQFEKLTEQTKELSAFGQKMTNECVEPIARSFNQVLKKAS